MHNYFDFFRYEYDCALVVALSEKQGPFSITIGNGELMHEWFPNIHAWKQQERNRTKKTDEEGERHEYGKKHSGHEKRSPDGLSHPNQNTIIINITW